MVLPAVIARTVGVAVNEDVGVEFVEQGVHGSLSDVRDGIGFVGPGPAGGFPGLAGEGFAFGAGAGEEGGSGLG